MVILFAPPHTASVTSFIHVGRSLVQLGHQVHVVVPVYMFNQARYNSRGVNTTIYGQALGDVDEECERKVISHFWSNKTSSASELKMKFSLSDKITKTILKDKNFLNKLKTLQPDMFVLSNDVAFRDLVSIPHSLGVPFSYLGPRQDYIGPRVPTSCSSTVTHFNDDVLLQGMTFIQRLKNCGFHWLLLAANVLIPSDVTSQPEISIVETDHVLDYPRPHLANTRLVGSTAGNDEMPISEPFHSFMEESHHGVVVVSLGSLVVDLPLYVTSKLTSVFMKLKQNVVWRVKMTSPLPGKIMTSPWLPQNDLVSHENTVLLVSGCGSYSQHEAVYHAVATLCLPVTADQLYNTQAALDKGLALKGDIRLDSAEVLLALMEELIHNQTYQENVDRASRMYRSVYKHPANEAAFWLDHVLTFGGSHLRSIGQNMTLYQFLGLDIAAVLTSVFLAVCCVVCMLCRCCWSKNTGRVETVPNIKKKQSNPKPKAD